MGDAVAGALVKLIPFVWENFKNEKRLASDAKGEFDGLKDLIRDIDCFLKKAYSKEVIDEELKACIKKMRKFLYVCEDAIDDFMRCESNTTWEGLGPYLYHHYNGRTFATAAKEIKTMVGNYITAPERRETLDGLSGDHPQSSLAGHRPSSIAFSEETDALVGIRGATNQLVQWLIENPSMSKVIFVHGKQGVGKSSLVGAVLRNLRGGLHFKYYVWIEDLRYCESVENRAAPLTTANAKMWNLTTGGNLGVPVKLEQAFRIMTEDVDLMENKKSWALVLDDASRADVFESIWGHLIETHPSVLVTSRVSSLASKSSNFLNSLGAQYVSYDFKHVVLSKNDSRTLFCRKMFRKDTYQHESKDACDSILKKCEGLPLAILATCELLNCKRPNATGTPDGVKWKRMSGRLGEELLSNEHEGGPIRRMTTLRMDHLLDIRACLFYLSIFPLDCPIRCSTMMRLWMAERFIEQEGSKPVQEKAEETLQMLLEHNVIQEKKTTSYGRVKTCRVHNLLHQIIVSKSKDEEFAMIIAGQVERWPENVWHLCFHSDMNSEYDGTWLKQLRSLLVFKKVCPKSLEKLLEKVERLKVLDLQRHLTKEEENCFQSSLNSFPQKMLQSKYLRYLSLRGTKVKKIPTGIEDLTHLETLDLRGTFVLQLPKGILKLKVLRHLLVYRSNGTPAADTVLKLGVKAPSKLGVLTSLEKLCMIEINPVKWSKLRKNRGKGGQLLEELGKLAKLQRLGISMLRSTDVELLCSSIEKLTNLEALRLIAAEGEKINLSKEDKRKAPESLQRVHLAGCLGPLPNWILSPDSLVKLVLKRSQLTDDPLKHLGNLRCLKHLELQQAFDVPEMTFEAGKFQQLCFLGLDKFDKLASIQVEEGALPTLERLSLARCKLLTTVPQVITGPRKLKCLELCGMPEEFNTAVKGNQEVRAHMKVKFKDWRDGAVEEVITLPAHHAGSPSVALPCMK